MLADEIRIELLKILVPVASRVGITDPEHIIGTCKKLEEYVSSAQREDAPASPSARKPGRPLKETSVPPVPAFLDPAAADKSNSGQA